MEIIAQILFVIALGITTYLIVRRARRITANIQLGRSEALRGADSKRWQKMLLLAFGQKKMFNRPLVGVLHFIIYAGFILINIEVLEIVLDGLLGTHRIFASVLPVGFYTFLISFFEFLAVGVIVSCVVFLIRRNVLKIERFRQPELKGWPFLDANLILLIEIFLMICILSMNATDMILQDRELANAHYVKTGTFAFSQFLVPLFSGIEQNGALVFIERLGWWLHILGIMAFAVYVTYSKHLHIFLAFPNTYYATLEPLGKFKNMEAVTKEVKIAAGLMEDDGEIDESLKFGANDVTQLTWRNIMHAYACTECGRCTAECPANITGKKLSPRKVMMDTRDRAENLGLSLQKGKTLEEALAEGHTLYSEEYISKEEIMACTTCNACVQVCPVGIDPLSIIMQIRQYIAMEEADTPSSWNAMFQNIETSMAPWKFPPSDRDKWVNELGRNGAEKTDEEEKK